MDKNRKETNAFIFFEKKDELDCSLQSRLKNRKIPSISPKRMQEILKGLPRKKKAKIWERKRTWWAIAATIFVSVSICFFSFARKESPKGTTVAKKSIEKPEKFTEKPLYVFIERIPVQIHSQWKNLKKNQFFNQIWEEVNGEFAHLYSPKTIEKTDSCVIKEQIDETFTNVMDLLQSYTYACHDNPSSTNKS